VIVFGLGNPGDEYLFSRHNLGFMVSDALALERGWRFRSWKNSLVATGRFKQEELWIIKPMTYMNESGRAVKEALAAHDDRFLVVVDDVDLDFGYLRIRKQGGTSGHNGLASIAQHLETEEFPRLRIGLGPRPDGADLSAYVLSPFTQSQIDDLQMIIQKAKDAVLLTAVRGIDVAMNEVNQP
jgi:PTH1 family peptidyl-tRNA hydrolase